MKTSPFLKQAILMLLSLTVFTLLNLLLMRTTNFTGWLNDWDARLLLRLNRLHSPWLGNLFDFMAGTGWWAVVSLCIAAFLYRHYGERALLLTLMVIMLPVLTYLLTNEVVKPLFGRMPPAPQGSSERFCFVSAKTAAAIALAVFLWRVLDNWERLLKMLVLGYAFLVAFDRLCSGQHYPGDVLGGLVFGAITGYLGAFVFYVLNDLKPFV